MSNQTKLNSGAIFKNEKKTAENHPDYRGKINVDGIDKEIALWLKTASSGKKYFSVSIKEPYNAGSAAASSNVIDDDDLLF